ncbi:MAG: amidase [Betaproteobacteria bacterium]|nr:amidase [Betaproteobacteria bacterium]MDE2355004.1 amidase [Betaproteobacteria bacterium]
MTALPLHTLEASVLAQRLSRRDISAETLLRSCLNHIDAREPVVKAWAWLEREAALEQARQMDRGAVRGLLHGLPIGVKDLMDTADMPTAYGSPLYRNHRPRQDAAAVALARAEGALVLGKTVTTEFAVFHPGPTANPRNPEHTPGGSSSGSAAAVADRMVPLAFGTQTGGSIIRPAAYCGIVGYKPTFNTLPRSGVKALADSLDTVGSMARSVRDAALFAAAASGFHGLVLDETPAGRPRIGLCPTWEWEHCEAAQQQAVSEAAATLSRAGFSVKEMPLPLPFSRLAAAQYTVMLRQQYLSLSGERLHHWEGLSSTLQGVLSQGAAVTDHAYWDALGHIRHCQALFDDLFRETDLLLAPSVSGEAPHSLASTGNPLLQRVWTALHGPALHLPSARGPQGLPVGVTLAGRPGTDRAFLQAAQTVETALGVSEHV